MMHTPHPSPSPTLPSPPLPPPLHLKELRISRQRSICQLSFMTSHRMLLAAAAFLSVAAACATPLPIASWALAPSSNVSATPAQISSTDYDASGWLNVTVPCTVMACLIQNGLYPDVFHGGNLAKVPTLQFNQTWWCAPRSAAASLCSPH